MPKILSHVTAILVLFFLFQASRVVAQDLLIETESFENHGGWKLDTQFIDTMGSPYLIAHGLGKPVENASTEVTFSETGEYRVFVRTLDWVARWESPGTPGRFAIKVDGRELQEFGNEGADWHWQAGGNVQIDKPNVKIELIDRTGFDGRCDAILFTKSDDAPTNDDKILPAWRREMLGLDEQPVAKDGYHLVVVGGGYAGLGAAISAARMGCKVALIQNRGVLGGNGSSEVRVWAMGNIRRGLYPRVGEIIEEIADKATKSPGTYEEFEDAKKEAIVRAEPNIDLFLNHHAFKVETKGQSISAVHAFDTRTSQVSRFSGRMFVDCTGHGTIGYLAGADWDMTDKGRMGMSNMWAWAEAGDTTTFPNTPWALDLQMKDFPYPRDFHGQWFWESGFDKNPLGGAEAIRDWNLRAVFGAFNAMKNRDGAADHQKAMLTWVAYIGGPRESRRLMGDVVLTEQDIVEKKQFKDGCVPSTWSIDLHYPKEQYAEKFRDNPFISIAKHDRRIDRMFGYPVPYRCFYSRNIDNLFMAGRNISVTHEALGTTRVMKTCGMMGEVVGRASSICVARDCKPREVYTNYFDDLDKLMKLPGKARRNTVFDQIVIPADAMVAAGPRGPMPGIDPAKLGGTVIDDKDAKKTGKWTEGDGLKGFVGYGYVYAGSNSGADIQFDFESKESGVHEVLIAYLPHENRGDTVPVAIRIGSQEKSVRVNMKQPGPIDRLFVSVGTFEMKQGQKGSVVVSTEQSGGTVHADAIQVRKVE